MTNKVQVIIIKESVTKTLIKSVAIFSMAGALMCVGAYVQSAAMQWFAFIIVCLTIVGMAKANSVSMSIDDARAKLDELEAQNDRH